MKNKILNEDELIHRGKNILWTKNINKILHVLYENKEYIITIKDAVTKGKHRNTFITLEYNNKLYTNIPSNSVKNCNFRNILKSEFIINKIIETGYEIDYDKNIKELGYSKEYINNILTGSDIKLYFKCKSCKQTIDKPLRFTDIVKRNRKCSFCNDKMVFPEKMMINILRYKNIKFKKEFNKKDYKWCDKYKYDFYFELDGEKYIIETNGLQHYGKGFNNLGGRTLEEEQQNDKFKKELALNNGIKEENYIVIDCRKSEFEFIKNNIINSRLNNIFDLSDADWNKISLKCEKSEYIDIWNDWNNSDKTTEYINVLSKKYNHSRHYILQCLKEGNSINLCDYDVNNIIKQNEYKRINNLHKYKVKFNNEEKYFNLRSEICNYYNISLFFVNELLKSGISYTPKYKNSNFKYKYIKYEGMQIIKIK